MHLTITKEDIENRKKVCDSEKVSVIYKIVQYFVKEMLGTYRKEKYKNQKDKRYKFWTKDLAI